MTCPIKKKIQEKMPKVTAVDGNHFGIELFPLTAKICNRCSAASLLIWLSQGLSPGLFTVPITFLLLLIILQKKILM